MKTQCNILIDVGLKEKAKKYNLNISKIAEQAISNYIERIERKNDVKIDGPVTKKDRFERMKKIIEEQLLNPENEEHKKYLQQQLQMVEERLLSLNNEINLELI